MYSKGYRCRPPSIFYFSFGLVLVCSLATEAAKKEGAEMKVGETGCRNTAVVILLLLTLTKYIYGYRYYAICLFPCSEYSTAIRVLINGNVKEEKDEEIGSVGQIKREKVQQQDGQGNIYPYWPRSVAEPSRQKKMPIKEVEVFGGK